MRRLARLLLLSAAGCSGFAAPTPALLDELGIAAAAPATGAAIRCRIRMSIDSPWLAGEFEGIVAALKEGTSAVVRAQLFGDVGPKMVDLLARRDRIIGFFPQAREGVDCALPDEEALHPLVLMGATLVEDFSELVRERVDGLRPEDGGTWLRLRPAVLGPSVRTFLTRDRACTRRQFRWMYGLGWEEEWTTPDECRITAANLRIRVTILERQRSATLPSSIFELALPADVRIAKGSRK